MEDVGEDQLVMKQKPGIYDALFEEDSDEESFPLPKGGIQAAVNALRLALKHPVTFSVKGQKPISFAATLSPTAKERLKSQRLKRLGTSPSSSPVPPPLSASQQSPKKTEAEAEKPGNVRTSTRLTVCSYSTLGFPPHFCVYELR